jgi:hypothetical protein
MEARLSSGGFYDGRAAIASYRLQRDWSMIRNSVTAFLGVFRLFGRLRGFLRVAWGLLVSGMILVVTGYFTWELWQSWTGLALMLGGAWIVVAELSLRKRDRDAVAKLAAGLLLAFLVAAILFFLMAILGAGVFLVDAFRHGVAWHYAARLLHFAGIGFAFFWIMSVPIAIREGDKVIT